jgi:hypothetical protein
MENICLYCNKSFLTKSNLKNHIENAKYCIALRENSNNSNFSCDCCDKKFTSKNNLNYHLSRCNFKKDKEIEKLKKALETTEKLKIQNEIHKEQIEELKECVKDKDEQLQKLNIPVTNKHNFNKTLVLNDITIIARREDGYINATEICKAGGKEFSNWLKNKNSEAFLQILSSSLLIRRDELIKYESGSNDKRGTWTHPQVAINIAQWISPQFDVQVSKWVFELTVTGRVELGNEKTNSELEFVYQDKINNLNKELELKTNKLKNYETTIFNRNVDYCPIEYYGKDIVYFLKFNIPTYLQSEYTYNYPNLNNEEYKCVEFGVSSNVEKRLVAHKNDKKKCDTVFLHAIELHKRYMASKMELYLKTISKQMTVNFDYENRKECILVNEEQFNTLINKINTGLNNLEDNDTVIELEDNKIEDFINYKIDKDIEIHKIDTNKDIEIHKINVNANEDIEIKNKKIQNITELFKNNIINLKEYKELLIEI